MRALLICLVAMGTALMTACGQKVEKQEACNFVQTSNLRRISWKHNFPIKMYIHESVPASYIPVIEKAGETWKNVFGYPVFDFVAGTTGSLNASQDDYSVIYNQSTWDSGADEQARTTVHWVGSRLFEADVSLNDYNFNFFIDESLAPQSGPQGDKKVHLESLIVHELGHVLGLSHSKSEETVMKEKLNYGEVRTKPSAEDQNSIKCEYQTL